MECEWGVHVLHKCVCVCVCVGVNGWMTCGGGKKPSVNLGCANCALIVKYSRCLLSYFVLVVEHPCFTLGSACMLLHTYSSYVHVLCS